MDYKTLEQGRRENNAFKPDKDIRCYLPPPSTMLSDDYYYAHGQCLGLGKFGGTTSKWFNMRQIPLRPVLVPRRIKI